MCSGMAEAATATVRDRCGRPVPQLAATASDGSVTFGERLVPATAKTHWFGLSVVGRRAMLTGAPRGSGDNRTITAVAVDTATGKQAVLSSGAKQSQAYATDGVTDVVSAGATSWPTHAVAITKGKRKTILQYGSSGGGSLAPTIVKHQLYYGRNRTLAWVDVRTGKSAKVPIKNWPKYFALVGS